MMRSADALPAAPLAGNGPVTRRFRALGVGDYRTAARGRSLDDIWTVREACIAALSDEEVSR